MVKLNKKSPVQIKKDLEIFKKGVERLKELEMELNSLDSRGFSFDEQKIRMKLKNVSDIPIIEKEIKILRAKIDGKYRPKRKRKSRVEGELKELNKKLENIKQNIKSKKGSKAERRLLIELNEKIDSIKQASIKKRGNIDSGVGVLVDTDFNSFLSDVKARLSDRIKGKEEEIEEVLRSDLQKRELDFKKKHDDMIREFNIAKQKMADDFENKYSIKVKNSLKNEVAEKFNSELKRKLEKEKFELGKKYKAQLREHVEKKLKKEEDSLKNKFNRKIKLLETNLLKNNRKIEDEFVDKYSSKLHDLEVKRQIFDIKQKKFIKNRKEKERKLEEKIKIESLAMSEKIGKEKEEMIEELKKEKIKMVSNVGIKERMLNNSITKNKKLTEEIQNKIKENKIILARTKKELEEETKRKILEKKKEMVKMVSNVGIKERMLNNSIAKNKKLTEEVQNKIKENKIILARTKKELEEETKRKIVDEKNKLAENFHNDLDKELKEKEKSLRISLRGEYDLILKQKISEHENELKKKKLNLEIEIQRKMKEALS